MQYTMQDQYSQLTAQTSSIFFRVSPRRQWRNSNVSQISLHGSRGLVSPTLLCALCVRCVNLLSSDRRSPPPFFRGKRKHIRGPFLLAKGLIHPRNLGIAYQANGDVRIPQIHLVLYAPQKRFEWLPRHADRTLAVQNHAG